MNNETPVNEEQKPSDSESGLVSAEKSIGAFSSKQEDSSTAEEGNNKE